MLTPFKLALGGPIGRGRRFMSWIALDDLVAAIHFCLTNEEMRGPVNAVAPTPMRNAEFTRQLARVLKRPAFVSVPPAALRAALGQMADELLLAGNRIYPARLTEAGFRFDYPELERALRFELGLLGPQQDGPEFEFHG
jgi:hypothetical protein